MTKLTLNDVKNLLLIIPRAAPYQSMEEAEVAVVLKQRLIQIGREIEGEAREKQIDAIKAQLEADKESDGDVSADA